MRRFWVPKGRPGDYPRTIAWREGIYFPAVDETLLYGRSPLQVTPALEEMMLDLLRVAPDDRSQAVAPKLKNIRDQTDKPLAGDASFAGDRSSMRRPTS